MAESEEKIASKPKIKKPPVKKPQPPKDLKPLAEVIAPRQLSIVRFSSNGKLLLGAGFDAKVFRWKLTQTEPTGDFSFSELPPLEGHQGWITGMALSAVDERLYTADSWGNLICRSHADESFELRWSIAQAHEGWIRQVAVSPDGKIVATCGLDGKVKLWSADNGKPLHSWGDHAADVYSVTFHPDDKSLVSGDIHGTIIQWDIDKAKSVRRFEAEVLYFADEDTLQDVGGVRRLIFDTTGRTLAACGGKPSSGGFVKSTPVIRFFDWATGETIETREFGHEKAGFVHDALFHAKGYLIGITSGMPGEGQLFFWRPGEEKPYFIYSKLFNCHSVTLHPDVVRFAVASTGKKNASNGRDATTDEAYEGNISPISLWDVTQFNG